MQKSHRTFIAISLPPEVRRELVRCEDNLADLPAKWTPRENLHITLVFLGNLDDVELGQVCMKAKEVAKRHRALTVELTKIGYEQDKKLPPKMVWATGEKSRELSLLKNDLENALAETIVNFEPENRGFAPHVTLARINGMAWRGINPEERPEVQKDIDLIFTAETIEVMESEMKKGGPEYVVVESVMLGE